MDTTPTVMALFDLLDLESGVGHSDADQLPIEGPGSYNGATGEHRGLHIVTER